MQRLSVSTLFAMVPLGLGATISGCSGRSGLPEARGAERPAPNVRVVVAKTADIPILARPNGVTRALNEVTLRARVRGFLKEKHFEDGANVKKDQLLLVIDEQSFKVSVAQAQAKLDAARAELEKSKQSKAREVARAQRELDEAQLDLAKVEERRESNLLAKSATSRENYDRQVAVRKKSDAQVRADDASLQQAMADYDTNILAAQANVEKARADLDAAKLDLGYCRMTSPIDGRIGELQVKLGNLVGQPGSSSGDALVTIQQLDPMGVDIRPPSKYLPVLTRLVKSGLEVRLRVEGERVHHQPGKVTFLNNVVDSTTSTVQVRADVPNPEQVMLPGEYVKVDMNIGDYLGVIAVPEQAVATEVQEGARVLVVDSKGEVASRSVRPIDTYEGLSVLESGLQPGERVIVEGVQLVRPGQVVKAEEVDLESFRRKGSSGPSNDPFDSPVIRLRGAGQSDNGPSTPHSEPANLNAGGEASRASSADTKRSAGKPAP